MLDRKRVEAASNKLAKAYRNPSQNALTGVAYAYEDLKDFNAGNLNLFAASGMLDGIANALSGPSFIQASTPQARRDSLALTGAFKWFAYHFHMQAIAMGERTFFNPNFAVDAGISVPMMQSFGWVKEADAMMSFIWTELPKTNKVAPELFYGQPDRGKWINEHSNPYVVSKAAWFASLSTFSDPAPMATLGYDPDMESLGAYWMLAQVWDDPNPAKVRNALLAVREHNIGTAFIKDEPEGSRVHIVDEFLLLYDYDIRSVNMRRKLMGLPVVEVEDYIYDMDLPLEVLPFAKDDVFYPAYLKMCAELGAEPYVPDNSIDVRIDPETLTISRV